ncbi:MAG TPA: hypothetical protein VFA56_10350 [Gaiellaceae bacterium]|nr:hypothetical protein [Gaiellaceae bacterium]
MVAAAVAAFVAPAGAHVQSPGPQCGGTLWKQMTLSDDGKTKVNWAPAATSIPDIAKLRAPAKVGTTRTSAFQRQVWSMKAVIERYRVASNGEIVLQLYDVPTSTYMNAYLPASQCLPTKARGRSQMLAARGNLERDCPAPTTNWQMLGATADLAGVGFFNPVKTTLGALKNGAELRPLVSLKITQGCGHF